MKQNHRFQVIIVGAGMVGASCALMCARLGLRVALIESIAPSAQNSPAFDQRAIALSASSVKILQSAGIWPLLSRIAAPIEHIQVSDQGHYGQLQMHQREQALGQVLTLEEAASPLWQALQNEDNIQIFCPARAHQISQTPDQVSVVLHADDAEPLTICGELLLACDGTFSNCAQLLGLTTERQAYSQSALIANVSFSHKRPGWAFERFTSDGPLALLPLTDNRWSLVWCGSEEQIRQRLALEADDFIQALQRAYGYRMGRITKVGSRHGYPLALHRPTQQCVGRVLLLGNAAHTLHPIAGQGFNLGLRGVAWLVEYLAQRSAAGLALWQADAMQTLVARLDNDFQQTSRATHALVRAFSNDNPLLILARTLGMHALARMPLLLNLVSDFGKGQRSPASPLACGIPLQQLHWEASYE